MVSYVSRFCQRIRGSNPRTADGKTSISHQSGPKCPTHQCLQLLPGIDVLSISTNLNQSNASHPWRAQVIRGLDVHETIKGPGSNQTRLGAACRAATGSPSGKNPVGMGKWTFLSVCFAFSLNGVGKNMENLASMFFRPPVYPGGRFGRMGATLLYQRRK